MLISLSCIHEEKPSAKWQAMFQKSWPFYKEWFLVEGASERPGYLTSSTQLELYMPELMPIYTRLCELAGGDDLSARYLSMYCPPPYIAGCSQLALNLISPTLIRNYDYNPYLFEGVMLKTNWLQPVIGMVDCNWGLLDGVNASGLSASLAFGGRKVKGIGFGIPLVIRYLLETCHSVIEATQKLKKLPIHMAYNITLVDKYFDYATVYSSPDRGVIISKDRVATNQQQIVEWDNYELVALSQKRMDFIHHCLSVPNITEENLIHSFSQSPLHVKNLEHSFVTIYTAVYKPLDLSALIKWEGNEVYQSFSNFKERVFTKKILKK